MRGDPISVELSNAAGGFTSSVQMVQGDTIGDLFRRECNGRDPANYLIRVNGEGNLPSNRELSNGDRVTITPTKVEAGS